MQYLGHTWIIYFIFTTWNLNLTGYPVLYLATLGRKKKKTGGQVKGKGIYESGYLKFVPLTFDSSDCRFTKKTSVYNLTSHEELATGKE